jgi:SAM-dependent methyltransferase
MSEIIDRANLSAETRALNLPLWAHYQTERGDIFLGARTRQRFLSRLAQPSECVLNIGLGEGYLEELLVRKGCTVSLLDPDSKSVAAVQSRLSLGDRAKVGSIESLPFASNSFDVVFVSEVVEHLSPALLRGGLIEIRRVLKPGGRLVGTTPADENLRDNECKCPSCGLTFHKWGHLQSFSAEGLKAILSEELTNVSIRRRFFPNWSELGVLGKIQGLLRMILTPLGAPTAYPTFVFIAYKRN